MPQYHHDIYEIMITKGVAPATTHALKMYVEEGVPTGSFLEALLSNQLMQTFSRADMWNSILIKDIVNVVYNYVPEDAHGSPENYRQWVKQKGLNFVKEIE